MKWSRNDKQFYILGIFWLVVMSVGSSAMLYRAIYNIPFTQPIWVK